MLQIDERDPIQSEYNCEYVYDNRWMLSSHVHKYETYNYIALSKQCFPSDARMLELTRC